jgi:hypothetical protein
MSQIKLIDFKIRGRYKNNTKSIKQTFFVKSLITVF